MATAISQVTDAFGSNTLVAAEIGAGALNIVRSSTSSVAAASSQTSDSFTITSAKVIDGVVLWVKQGGAGSTGTFKVDLQKGGVSQASVTVNKTDLPDTSNANPVPVLFKFSSTATGDGASNWTIVLTTTGTNSVTYNIYTAGAANLSRAVRTTTAAVLASGDNLYILGELTGAGTYNGIFVRTILNNFAIGDSSLSFPAATALWLADSHVSFQKYGQTAGDHRTYMKNGMVQTDAALFKTATPSMRMTPSGTKLESATRGRGLQAAVNSGGAIAATVWLNKGPTYAGRQPRLILRVNAAIGVNADTVLATDSSAITSTLWTPSQLGSDVWAWWKFDAMPEADTIAVATVTDASGNSRVLTTSGSPTAKANAQNGLKSLNFAGGTKYATFAATSSLTAGSFFAVNKAAASPSDTTFGGICDTGSDTQLNHYTFSGTVYSDFLTNARKTAASVTVNVWHQVMFWSAPSDWGHAMDGTDKFTTASNTVAGIATGYLASDTNFGTWRHQGEFGEVVILNNKPTLANRQKVEGYLAYKWGLQGSLDVAHPYKSAPPTVGGTWISLSGSTMAATDDGVMEFVVDCDGAAGFISVDDWSLADATPVFYPTALPGLIGWWDANAPASLTLTGSDIYSVADQSAAGQTMNWANAHPTYSATGLGSAKPALMFAGSTITGWLSVASGFPMGTGIPLTAWFVGGHTGSTAGAARDSLALCYDSSAGVNSSGNWSVQRVFGTANQLLLRRYPIDTNINVTIPALHRIIITIDSANVKTMYVDGVPTSSAAFTVANWTSGGMMTIGGRDPSNNTTWDGPIAEAGVATSFSNSTTVAALDAYLANKWGTTLVNTVAPVISGFNYVGYPLTTTNGTWTGITPVSYTYQWKRNGSNISGATASLYTPVTADLGATITVTVTAVGWIGNVSATSSGVGPIAPEPPFAPTLLAGLVGWWDASVTASLSLTGSSINSVADQSGHGYSMTWLNAKPTYNATGFNSSTKPAIVFAAGSNTSLNTASGVAMGTGNTLTAWFVGTLGGATSNGNARVLCYTTGNDDTNSAGFWGIYRPSGTASALIRNSITATSSALSADPAPHRMIYTINSSGLITIYADGVAVGTATSGGNWVSGGSARMGYLSNFNGCWITGPVAECGFATGYSDAAMVAKLDTYLAGKWMPTSGTPAIIVPPVISGSIFVGQVLTTSDGIWNGIPTSYSYQWNRGGVAISGATANTYTLVTGDLGATITATVTASNSFGSVSTTTASVGPIVNFSPAVLSGLAGWWDTSVTASLSLTGSSVNSITDQSGGGQTMNWANAKPTYNATGFNTTKPGMLFNSGSGTGLVTASGFPMGTGTTLTMWYVGTMPTSGGTGRACSYNAPGQFDWNNTGSWGMGGNPTTCFLIRNSTQSQFTASASPAGHRFIATVTSGGVMTVYVDGVANTPATSSGNWVSAGTVSFGTQGGTDFWSGTISEAGVATSYSDASVVAALDTFLKNKWGL
jgi:hypothetical protein